MISSEGVYFNIYRQVILNCALHLKLTVILVRKQVDFDVYCLSYNLSYFNLNKCSYFNII